MEPLECYAAKKLIDAIVDAGLRGEWRDVFDATVVIGIGLGIEKEKLKDKSEIERLVVVLEELFRKCKNASTGLQQ